MKALQLMGNLNLFLFLMNDIVNEALMTYLEWFFQWWI